MKYMLLVYGDEQASDEAEKEQCRETIETPSAMRRIERAIARVEPDGIEESN